MSNKKRRAAEIKQEPYGLRYFDAFAGVGGFGLGVHMVDPKAVCVGYSEIEQHANAVSLARFPGATNFGDAVKLRWDGKGVDLLMGGVPCQSWSIAGNRGGFDDSRGKMWHAYSQMLRRIRPTTFIAENVKGILSHDGGRSFARIVRMLEAAGYKTVHATLNAHDFGVPQNRERVFIVGFRNRSQLARFAFPAPTRPGTVIADILEGDVPERYFVKPEAAKKLLARMLEKNQQSARIYQTAGMAPSLRSPSTGGMAGPYIDEKVIARNQRGEVRLMLHSGSLTAKKSAKQFSGLIEKARVRRFTPTECERLMGWPDGWTKYGVYQTPHGWPEVRELADTNRYMLCGNGVAAPVVAEVVRGIIRALK